MRQICFFLMMSIALTASAAGLQQLVNGITPNPVVPPQPAPPPPKPPVKK